MTKAQSCCAREKTQTAFFREFYFKRRFAVQIFFNFIAMTKPVRIFVIGKFSRRGEKENPFYL